MNKAIVKKEPKKHLKQLKIFSKEVKTSVVRDIESGKYSVSEAAQDLMVSKQCIYTWLYKFSRYLQKGKVLVVEERSQQSKIKDVEQKLKETEAALGRKEIENSYLNKIIEIASEELNIDIKKNFCSNASTGFEKIKK